MKIFPLVMVLVGMQAVEACDLCSVYSASQAEGSGKGFYGGIAEQFTYFGTLRAMNQDVGNDERSYITSSLTQVFAGYNFNSRFGLQINLPVINREYGVTGKHGSETGIGDVSVIANVLLYQKISENFTFNWTALGGLKLPTGNTDWLGRPDFAEGIGGHDLTFGSGSVDGLIGTGFYARWKRAFLGANTQYSARTEGDHGYQFANDWTWAGGPGVFLLLNHKCTLTLQAAVSGESKGADNSPEGKALDSAETIVYLGPQIAFTWGDRLSANIGADLPVSVETPRASDDPQLVPGYRIHAAVTWRF
ncbi:MAG TPA: hypothetical protein VH255_05860 [Verrucomicrobiae bacterium]|jgi:hypothetical protein|nr:hypothetical protein [Verrucomicrobiae bacterium]